MLRAQAARLLAVDREATGTRLLLLKHDEASVGSAEGSGLHVADASVADRHAIIRYRRGRYYVVDLKSAEGTFLNGRRIRRRQELKHGDTVRFGGAAPYRFIDPDALKRRRWRRILRLIPVVALLVAVGSADHIEKWGLLSATLAEIAALARPQAISKPVEPPATIAASAPTRLAAPSAQTTSLPGPAAYVANVAPTAPPRAARPRAASTRKLPLAASTPKLPASAPTPNLSASSSMPWLERVNFYRAALGLDPIRNNPDLSAAATAHARYLLLNFGEDLRSAKPMSGDAYEEKPGNRGYSASGAAAARNLQLAWGCSSYDTAQQIDRWLEGPFHRIAVFDPDLTEAGYGEAGSDGCWVAALRLPQPPPEEEKPYPRAIEFPPDRADVALDWIGLEAPDPLESCPGYSRPVGLPITLQIGRLVDTKLTAHSLTEDGKPIEHCAFDADSYRNHIKALQTFGHWNLRDAGAVVIVPRAPLRAGSRYSVSITAAGETYAWTFKVADVTTFAPIAKFPTSPPAPPPMAEPSNAPSFSPPPPPIERHTRRAAPAPEATTSMSGPEEYAGPRPTSKPIPEASPAAVGSGANWLTVLNRYRTRLNVPPVEEDPSLSNGCIAHAKYLMRNYGGTFRNIGILMHEEDQSKPGYSLEGRKAAQASDIVFQSRNRMTDDQLMEQAIQWWISGPFHRGQLVNPELRRVGFAQYCEGARCVSALNTTSDVPLASISGRRLPTPIEVPPDGATVKTPGFGGEWPNPVSSCSGYSTKSPAVTLNLGVNVTAKITDAHLTQTTGAAAGTILDTCAYDSDSYTNPNAGDQERGRQVLRSFGEVVMMVRDPLSPGENYRVAMTVNGKLYSWSFTAAP